MREFTTKILESEQRVHILINNASVMWMPLKRTAEGHEYHWGYNHIAHFAMTQLLMPLLLRYVFLCIWSIFTLLMLVFCISGELQMRASLPCHQHGTSMVPFAGTIQITLKIASIAPVKLTINPNWPIFFSHESWLEDSMELVSMRES